MTQPKLNQPSIFFGPWPGGVNYSQPAEFIKEGELFSMQNCRIDVEGSVATRGGITKHHTSALNSGTSTIAAAKQIGWSPTSDSLVAVAGNQFLEDADKDGNFVDLTNATTITAGQENLVSMAFGDGRLMLCNGVDATPLTQTAKGGGLATQDVDSRFTAPKFVAYWDNRAWWAYLTVGGSLMPWRVWRSDVEDVTTYGATNFHNVLAGQAEIVGIKPWGDFLAIHFKAEDDLEGIAAIMPSGIATIPNVVRILGDKASVANGSIQNLPDGRQIFARPDGVYTWRRTDRSYEKVSGNLDGPRYWDNINRNKLYLAHSVLFEDLNQYRLTVPYGTTQTRPNHTIVYDYLHDRWMGPETNFTAACSFLMDRKVYVGGDDGFIRQHNTTTKNDDAAAVDSWFYTAALRPAASVRKFRWLVAQHYFDAVGAWYVTVQQLGPSLAPYLDQFQQGDTFDAIGTTFRIGTSQIGGAGIADSEVTQLTGYDSHLQFFFRNGNANEPFRIRQTEAWFKPRKDS